MSCYTYMTVDRSVARASNRQGKPHPERARYSCSRPRLPSTPNPQMAWYSILPQELTHLESWAARVFFVLGLITIGPWAFLILLDATIWLYRMILWDFPWIGGRARGQQRPRAPSLNERPDGQRRAFGLRGVETDTGESDGGQSGGSSSKRENDRDESRRENVNPVVRLNPHAIGDGALKHRGTGLN
ncbi:hypothetical protein N7467_007297 [Penicillium canescens]|nr:hypothetical protein N7467_007297 [Penicillium canescens]